MSSLPPPPPPASSPSSTGAPATCYRHPGRPAYRRCTRCDRYSCDDCLVRGSVGSLCPECLRAGRPPTATRVRTWNATRGGTLATFALIGINVAVAFYTLSSNTVRGGVREGEVDLAVNRYLVDQGEWWRIITSGFTHFGAAHLLMNMVSLYFLGSFLEPALGRTRFVAMYFASLLAGTAGALILQPNLGITAGASGAIFGLLGAAAIALRQRGIGLLQTGIGMSLMLNLLITFTVSGISIGGHLGGLVGGGICGYIMLAPHHRRFPRWAHYVTPAAVAVVSVILCFVVSAGTTKCFPYC